MMLSPTLNSNTKEMPPNKAGKYLQGRANTATPLVSFVGTSGSGKTTLLEKVVRELKLKGCRVAVVKHSHHDFEIDQPGKDTWRLAHAGSDIVAITSPNKMALIESVDEELTLTQVAALFGERVDIVLAEGYKNYSIPQIVVLSTEQAQEQVCREENTLAVVSARWSPLGVPQFDDKDIDNIVSLLIEEIEENSHLKFKGVSNTLVLIPG